MVVTRGASTLASGSESDSTLQAAATATTTNSVFGGGKTSTSSTPLVPLKRKMTDQKLETITIDPMYDLTLIVGTPEHTKGQKAFQVSKGSFRNISPVWAKMMSGNWAESSQSEICLPDDNCDAFLIVLQIAHFQLSKLPAKLSREALVDLAVLTDKYQLATAVRMGLEMKKWMEPHTQAYMSRLPDAALQDYAVITSAFNLQNDCEYIISRLATELEIDDHDKFYYLDGHKTRVMLRSDLPTSISGEIERIRFDILSAWITCCETGIIKCMGPPPPCKNPLCGATKLGILVDGLGAACLFPIPLSATLMNGSVTTYWTFLQSLGHKYQSYSPCRSGTSDIDRSSSHSSICSFTICFGDFGVIDEARAVLHRHTHKGLWEKWGKW